MMKYAAPMAMFLVLLMGTALWAGGCNGCPVTKTVQVQCPAPCPQPCPTQCPTPCPAPCPACPCPAAVPAAMGAGPASSLTGLECPDFDPAYAQRMFEQNSVIIAVTEYGARTAKDRNLRSISREINGYTTSANSKLMAWFGTTGCPPLTMSTDCPRAEAIINELAQNCECFDGAYAATLSTLLKQSNAAEELARCQGICGPMRQQATFLARKTANWAFRLDRWVAQNPGT